MQRYFAFIELASSPFISTAGPAQFVGEGEVFAPASHVQILGPGTNGRSSHHGKYSMHIICAALAGYRHMKLFATKITHATRYPRKRHRCCRVQLILFFGFGEILKSAKLVSNSISPISLERQRESASTNSLTDVPDKQTKYCGLQSVDVVRYLISDVGPGQTKL